jgi:putative ABC transport system permease protein
MGWIRRFRNTLFDGGLNHEFQAEARAYFDELVREDIRTGATRERAERDARDRMGNLTLALDQTRDVDTLQWLDDLIRDVRLGMRQLRRTPGFALVAILTLALGIGANTAIFTLLHGLMFRDLSVKRPDQLVQLSIVMRNGAEVGLSVPAWRRIEHDSGELFSSIVAWTSGLRFADVNGEPFQANVWMVSGNFHSELATAPILGRLLTSSDADVDALSGQAVAVLGYGFWQRRFGGDPNVLGRTIRIEGIPFSVVGVTAPEFRGLSRTFPPELTVPLTAQRLIVSNDSTSWTQGNVFWVNVIARRRFGVSADEARTRLTAAWPNVLLATMPPTFAGVRRSNFLAIRLRVNAVVEPAERLLQRQFEQPLVIVMAIALFVLLIACLNLAGLMLARTLRRRHEIGVLLALGATRWRVTRQVFVEAILISLPGGVCGIVAAPRICQFLAKLVLSTRVGETASLETSPDASILAITAALTIGAPLLFSVAPAWFVTRRQSLVLLQRGGHTRSGPARLSRALVAGQLALCLILLINAGLLIRTLTELRATSPGFVTNDVFAVSLVPRLGGAHPDYEPAYVPALLNAVRSLPGVRDASVAWYTPGSGSVSWYTPGTVTGPPEFVADATSASGEEVAATYSAVSPDFFHVLSMPLQRGREFTSSDDDHTEPVAIASRALAARLFADADPIGRYIRIGVFPHRQHVRIVGIVGDARLYDVTNANVFAAYMPFAQDPRDSGETLLLRGARISARDISRAVDVLGREHAVTFQPLDLIRDRALLQQRLAAMLAEFFGVLALGLAAIGVYASTSYEVAERTRELGIRIALGATPRMIVQTVLARGGTAVATGVLVGLGVARVGGRIVQAVLFGITPHDRLAFGVATMTIVAVAMTACALGARRATRVDVNKALGNE